MKNLDRSNGETEAKYTLDELYLKRSPVNLKYEEMLDWD